MPNNYKVNIEQFYKIKPAKTLKKDIYGQFSNILDRDMFRNVCL